MSMLEAECTRCGETFVPHGTDPEDLIHTFKENEDECGGIGIILGEWVPPEGNYTGLSESPITNQEWHGVQTPNCSGKHCIYHHPELIKLP